MSKVILFKNDAGGVSIVTPAPEVLKHFTIEQVADKDIPTGKPYAIVDGDSLPTDLTFRDAWEVDETLLTDGIGNESNQFEDVAE